MNCQTANSLYGYLETLYITNKRLIKLCGLDVIDDTETGQTIILDIIQDIPRLIPFYYDKKKGNLDLAMKNGLMEYHSDISYLLCDYNRILNNHLAFLDSIRLVRNKYEHKMHDVRYRASSSGTQILFEYTFIINGRSITLCAHSFIALFKDLNELFAKISTDIQQFAIENNKQDYAYYRRICRFDFTYFNKIYDSDILRIVGKTMYDF